MGMMYRRMPGRYVWREAINEKWVRILLQDLCRGNAKHCNKSGFSDSCVQAYIKLIPERAWKLVFSQTSRQRRVGRAFPTCVPLLRF